MQTEFLDASAVRIEGGDGALALVSATRKTPLAPPRRALPLSHPDEYIVLTDCDGTEAGWVRSLNDLDEASREVLEKTLAEIYVVTRIARVREVDKEPLSGQIRWRVEIATDDTGGENAVETGAEDTGTEHAQNGDGAPKMGARLLKKLGRDRDEESSVEEREFFIAGTEDVQTARYPQIFIVDTERNRYEITDCEALDAESRRVAERYF